MCRVCLVINNLSGLYGFRREVVEALVGNGFSVTIIAPFDNKADYFKQLGCDVVPVPVDRRGTNPFSDLLLMSRYRKILRSIKPDVVLTYTVKPNVYAGILCGMLSIPHIANITGLGDSVENHGILRKIVLFLTRIGLKKTRFVFFQNKANKALYEDLGLVNQEKTILIPGSGVNLSAFPYAEYPPIDSDAIRILYAGRIMKDKGVGELLEAVQLVHQKHSNFTCDLVGSYEDESYIPLLEIHEASGAGKYLGRSNAMHQLYSKYHAIILPSYHEGMSNTLLEAASTGRPVLATNVPGCKETFDEGASGIGFEPRSVPSIQKALEEFIELPYEAKQEMGLAGRAKMEKSFNRQIVVDAYLDKIHLILNSKKDRTRSV